MEQSPTSPQPPKRLKDRSAPASDAVPAMNSATCCASPAHPSRLLPSRRKPRPISRYGGNYARTRRLDPSERKVRSRSAEKERSGARLQKSGPCSPAAGVLRADSSRDCGLDPLVDAFRVYALCKSTSLTTSYLKASQKTDGYLMSAAK